MSVTVPRRALPTAPRGYAIEVTDLRKSYRTRKGRHQAVGGLDLKVPLGGVHGFLGPNGSGKTTTIRMVLGLIRADSGHIRVFEADVPTALPRVIGRIGAIVEQPKFFPAFSGRRNLELLATAIGTPRKRVDEVLDEVGLLGREKDAFRKYSLGMKQRLAIAGTLLKDPDLLIFDEPTNGLDPAGIHEIRATMRGLADRGKTVLVSSHILSEVSLVADTVSIIGRGKLLAEGEVDDIIASRGGQAVRIGVADPARAASILAPAGFSVTPLPQSRMEVRATTDRPGEPGGFDPARITWLLAQQGLFVFELMPIQADLESVFLDLTAEEHLGASHPGGPPGPPPPQAAPSRAHEGPR
ncbi:ABC transporter ATP-binding protein [uncultured Friedmanniella sp.]|uniref:ABC transporter ATP-binding protein n=1 Tax=uncultured Friedmanniella sp. TaxID=335381 RepID=UPI0035CBF2C9